MGDQGCSVREDKRIFFKALPWDYSLVCWPEDFGITEKCFNRAIREFFRLGNQQISIVQYYSSGGHLTGVLIFDPLKKQVVLIGDGFRLDGKGEGGRGARKFMEFLDIFSPSLFSLEDSGFSTILNNKKDALNLAPIDRSETTEEMCIRIATGINFLLQKNFQSEEELVFFVPSQQIKY